MSTPVQQQYHELKKQNPDSLLFFRLGDFYELFYEDAQLASRLLGIALTARHRGTENEMPMCGFPHHAHEEYLEKLVEAGYKVAIAEQEEDASTGKITRSVVRVVTPGTSLETGNLDPEKHTFLAALSVDEKHNQWALAYADLSTGDFYGTVVGDEISFFDELYKIDPREVLLVGDLLGDEVFSKKLPETHLTPRKLVSRPEAYLKEHFGVKSLAVFEIEDSRGLVEAVSLIMEYLNETQKTDLSHIQKFVRYSTTDIMAVDQQTFRHLEIFSPIVPDKKAATLQAVFAKPKTSMGARKLRSMLAMPLLDSQKINQRLQAVSQLAEGHELGSKLAQHLKTMPDLQRLISRLVTGRANARDLVFLRSALEVFPAFGALLQSMEAPLLKDQYRLFEGFQELFQVLEKALVEHPPVEITAGGMFHKGYDPKLDELKTLAQDSESWLNNFLDQKKKDSGIENLKIKYSKTFGFCLEVSRAQKKHVPEGWIARQTLVNAERYTTPELAAYEQKALSAESQMFEREYELFQALRQKVLEHRAPLQKVAQAIAEVDSLLALAQTAQNHRWTKPVLVDGFEGLEIEKGRHPVVEILGRETFIANDLHMHEGSKAHLITGPNMAGKSTFLRQNALLIWLAQIGSFVPAKSYKAGIIDRIFTRVGASDNLAAGKSTFFVEMAETATILNAATDRSFIILDEIGRGTSTFDGISLAWAIFEYLHNHMRAKTLFATHYHELVELADDLPSAENFHVSVTQNQEGIVFLRHIKKGPVADSFGIEVAHHAGIPSAVIDQARQVLARLESENLLSGKPNLFSAPRLREKVVESRQDSRVQKALENLDPNELSPKQALEKLFELKNFLP